jgi:hypothetical protein
MLGESQTDATCGSSAKKKLKRGESLVNFFGGTDYGVPKFFHLQWPAGVATFEPTLPAMAKRIGEVQWKRAGRAITLCWTCTDGADEVPWQPPPERQYTNAHEQLLKSHLQKCTRRSLSDQAVATAGVLLRLNAGELLQRLGVIIVEDVMLFAGFPVLQWMMAACYKGFRLPKSMLEWVLGVVLTLLTEIALAVLVFLPKLVFTLLICLAELVLTALILLTELVVTPLMCLAELALTVLIFLTELVVTLLICLTGLVLTRCVPRQSILTGTASVETRTGLL